MLFKTIALTGLSLSLLACGKDGNSQPQAAKGAEGAKSAPAPFSLKIHKVEKLQEVAANEVLKEHGHGAKAAEGMTFYCLQYETENVGSGKLFPPAPRLQIAEKEYEVKQETAGKYMPKDWQEHVRGKLEPGKISQDTACFEVENAAAEKPASLLMKKEGWGKKKGWTVKADIDA